MATTGSETSSAVIDDRRAQQLMERAMNLAERNDLASAVLACRQAIALSPQASQSYSMLGLLLERAGDSGGAVAAYEKVLELSPDSFLERESLSRLRGAASQRRNAREMFAFDDNELFGQDSAAALPTATPADRGSTPTAKTPLAAAPVAASPTTLPALESKSNSQVKNSTPVNSKAATTSASVPASVGSTSGASATKPGAAAKTNAVTGRPSSMPFPSTQPVRAATSGLGVPLDLPMPASRMAKQSVWQRLKQRPTSYFRGLPLAGATAIGLIFLLWAGNYASSNRVVSTPDDIPVFIENPFDNSAPIAPPASPSSANPALTNQPAATGVTPVNPGAAAPTNPGAPSNAGVPTNPGAPMATNIPTNPGAPASPTNTAPRNTGSTPNVPSANAIPAPASAPTPGVAPSESGGSSAGGTPVAPAGTPSKEYVRIAPSGANPVARPENRAATDERNARSDAQAGRSNAAIENLSRAIESGGPDVALQYQQRAQIYLQGNDGARASSDFQAAISAYNDMIARGDRVAIARSGIAACRRGLQMAQARR